MTDCEEEGCGSQAYSGGYFEWAQCVNRTITGSGEIRIDAIFYGEGKLWKKYKIKKLLIFQNSFLLI